MVGVGRDGAGEVLVVGRIVDDQLQIAGRCRWPAGDVDRCRCPGRAESAARASGHRPAAYVDQQPITGIGGGMRDLAHALLAARRTDCREDTALDDLSGWSRASALDSPTGEEAPSRSTLPIRR